MGGSVITVIEIEEIVKKVIKKTINKFRENPLYFFTESDLHSYFYSSIYSSKLEVVSNNKRICLIHREYPTNFRYYKKNLVQNAFLEPYPLALKKGGRGHYDMEIINPKFAQKYSDNINGIKHIINKDVSLLEQREEEDIESLKKELVYAIEFKYVINNSKMFINEVKGDNKKLLFSTRWGVMHAVNLVFCNIKDRKNIEAVREEVKKAPEEIDAYFVQSWYDDDGKKHTPFPIKNH
jgi:hypothetical protein